MKCLSLRPWVPTGMNVGVSMIPWGVCSLPSLAPDCLQIFISSYVTAAIRRSSFLPQTNICCCGNCVRLKYRNFLIILYLSGCNKSYRIFLACYSFSIFLLNGMPFQKNSFKEGIYPLNSLFPFPHLRILDHSVSLKIYVKRPIGAASPFS